MPKRVPLPLLSASGPALLAVATALWIALDIARGAAQRDAAAQLAQARALKPAREAAARDAAEHASFRDLKLRDVAALKKNLPSLTQSRRALFEAGLQLQEEKHLLEKQWELMTTYLLIDEGDGRLRIMRGEESLESFPLETPTAKPYGSPPYPPPPLTTVLSKERFAHPERGKYEEKDGQLSWTPPQVGPASRADALGEFVVFTRGPLILHGPAKVSKDHAAYPHYCLELSLPVARKAYAAASLGAKILIQPAKSTDKKLKSSMLTTGKLP